MQFFSPAGLVGGIHANAAYPADFITNNLAIALNVIRGCSRWAPLVSIQTTQLSPEEMTGAGQLSGDEARIALKDRRRYLSPTPHISSA